MSNTKIKRALIIKEKWLNKIFSGQKTIELRSTKTKIINESIGLIRSESGKIFGTAIITNVIGPLSETELETLKMKHCFEPNLTPKARREKIKYKKVYGWIFDTIILFHRPIKYNHKAGCVIWIKIEAKTSIGISKRLLENDIIAYRDNFPEMTLRQLLDIYVPIKDDHRSKFRKFVKKLLLNN